MLTLHAYYQIRADPIASLMSAYLSVRSGHGSSFQLVINSVLPHASGGFLEAPDNLDRACTWSPACPLVESGDG